MSRLSFATVIIGAFLTSFVMSGWVSSRSPSCAMAINSDSSELQLQFLDGTPIRNFDWGDFIKKETKRLQCQLVYTGNLAVKVMWNTTSYPHGWSIGVEDSSDGKAKDWSIEHVIKLVPEQILPITIVLKEINGIPGKMEAFSLVFMSLGKAEK